ncbi:MAG: Ig-like domain-containing protein [Gemmatimonas sp.]|nr:Ig-like domain-containing protein [Gemmatimonadaceae bacterium]
MTSPCSARARRARAGAAFLGATGIAMFALGCGTDYVTIPRPTGSGRLFASLVLDHHAIALSMTAPSNAIQLTASALNAQGAPLDGAGHAMFSLSDTGSVSITPDGMLTAKAPATGVQVIASLTDGNLTHKDTAYVNVNDVAPPPVLASFSIQPLPGDSAKTAALDGFGLFGLKPILPQAADAGGTPIDGLPVFFSTADPTVATVDPATGVVTGVRPGTVKIRANTTAYGVTMSDSLVLTITPPLIGLVSANPNTPAGSTTPTLQWAPGTIEISAGGTVLFVTQSTTQDIDVVFDDPADVAESFLAPSGGGDIPPFRALPDNGGAFVARAFPVPGSYNYHSTTFDTHGTIIVR